MIDVRLFDRDWHTEENVMRCGEANVSLTTQRGQATPFSNYYSLKSKRGLRALEIEVRAHQDSEEQLLSWLFSEGYIIDFGPHSVAIGSKNDAYGIHPIFQASGRSLKEAALDLAARL